MASVSPEQAMGSARSSTDHAPRRVAVVGAGITGLVTAYTLHRRGVPVTLFEASEHVGGAIRTTHAEQFLAEHGPNSFVTSAPVEALIAELGLSADVVEASTTANRRYVVRDGRLVPFPMSPPAMLTTSLFSLRAKLRVLLEPLMPKGPATDESIASFVRRRLGHEVLTYAVDPFISGIFAGDPEQLSLTHAFPRIRALEQEHGSLSKGLMRQLARKRAAKAPPSADAGPPSTPAPTTTRLISFFDGLQTLPDALAAALGPAVLRGCPARLLHQEGSRWSVEVGDDEASRVESFDAVVLAAPAHVLAAMELPGSMRALAAAVEGVAYPPVSTLTLGFRREDVAHPLDGFGMLIPSVEGRSTLGVLFTSSLFPGRAPEGHVTMTCFVGGARRPAAAQVPTDKLVEHVLLDLQDLLGVRGEPVFAQHVFWPRAIPQYTIGYDAVKRAAADTETANPGLYLTGNYRNGVSVGDCVASGQQVATHVVEYLAQVR